MSSSKLETDGILCKESNFSIKPRILARGKGSQDGPFRVAGRRLDSGREGAFWIKSLIFLVVSLALGSLHTSAWGSGFLLASQGTAAMAQGNAFVAEANDPTAIFYNPAGLNQLKRPEVYVAGFFNHPDREFSGGGFSSQTNHRIYRPMSVFIAGPLHDRVAVGVGFFNPFGLGSAWPPTWAGRYITTFASLMTYALNPTVSVKLLDNLSFGAGIDMLWSTARLKSKTPFFFRGRQLDDAETNLGAGGNGVGYNLGGLYAPLPWLKLGVSYRSAIAVTHRGDLNTTTPLGSAPLIAGSAKLTFPPTVIMGVSCSYLKPFTFEFDTIWTGWSTYDQLKINLKSPLAVNGVPTRTIVSPKNWHDAWGFRFGANCEIKEGLKIRAGYIYDLTPVPDSTFDPIVPDNNRHVFAVGGDWKIKRFTLGLAYNYVLAENRRKNNQIGQNGVPFPLQANGLYKSDDHSLALSATFRF